MATPIVLRNVTESAWDVLLGDGKWRINSLRLLYTDLKDVANWSLLVCDMLILSLDITLIMCSSATQAHVSRKLQGEV